jgi:hypothetical protein
MVRYVEANMVDNCDIQENCILQGCKLDNLCISSATTCLLNELATQDLCERMHAPQDRHADRNERASTLTTAHRDRIFIAAYAARSGQTRNKVCSLAGGKSG